ncbi:hypothetical protein [Pseudorhodobacter wandonensis]|uniref:hypothetical protein n=1 Tax=Pseudorhodobacter wandonensis TaxID=1120568 RepID=UPI000A442FD2|nr:hypothetical protein [Pseudorhodobacter wandonensis]
MPARVFVYLILISIVAAGLTILAAQTLGLPIALLGVVFAAASLALQIWMTRR